MYEEAQPIEIYVSECFKLRRILTLVGDWRVDQLKLRTIVVAYIRDLGINFVELNQRKEVLELVVTCLKKAPEIKALRKKAEKEESEKRRSRHADI